MISETKDVFTWKDIKVVQNETVFKIGTDAILLGCWVPCIISSPRCILDVGTGSGILTMMMAHFFPDAKIHAIDKHEAAVQLAGINFQNSLWTDRLTLEQKDVFTIPDQIRYDLVICNPPFYFGQFQASTDVKAVAKHSKEEIRLWSESLLCRVNSKGTLGMVVPYEDAFKWIETVNGKGFFCSVRKDVYSFGKDEKPVRSLLAFTQTNSKPVLSRITIYDSPGKFTHEYLELTRLKPDIK